MQLQIKLTNQNIKLILLKNQQFGVKIQIKWLKKFLTLQIFCIEYLRLLVNEKSKLKLTFKFKFNFKIKNYIKKNIVGVSLYLSRRHTQMTILCILLLIFIFFFLVRQNNLHKKEAFIN